ncbi:hypothetical protein OSB04_026457 [Centaurea solstitialis]|uniref:RRM domain-containing protein n=1 Tax=Centaurea solstitialis TaxID=347529 RepID=A0AA38SP06_9ASTR|nr:hypothetical protein OSB04_026457 [Centaurea solstitialis]
MAEVEGVVGPFGDTTLTKVFVGGLAWETPKEAMRDHFEKYGDILEAVIISDKTTGRSKGYGFVTFKEPESAKKACEDPTPVINGRRANWPNVIVGPRSAGAMTPPPPSTSQPRAVVLSTNASTGVTLPPPHHQAAAVPYYGYAPATYVAATDVSYNHVKARVYRWGLHEWRALLACISGACYGGCAHTDADVPYVSISSSISSNGPAGPLLLCPTSAGPIAAVPALLSKPTQITPATAGIYLILFHLLFLFLCLNLETFLKSNFLIPSLSE